MKIKLILVALGITSIVFLGSTARANELMGQGIANGILIGGIGQSSNCMMMAFMGQTCPENRAPEPVKKEVDKEEQRPSERRAGDTNDDWKDRVFQQGN